MKGAGECEMEDSVTLERLLEVCTEINSNLVQLVEYLQAKDAAASAASEPTSNPLWEK